MIVCFTIFLAIVLALVAYNVGQRYEYVEEERRVWTRFERNVDSPFGVSNVYEDVKVKVLSKKQDGSRYSNGREVK